MFDLDCAAKLEKTFTGESVPLWDTSLYHSCVSFAYSAFLFFHFLYKSIVNNQIPFYIYLKNYINVDMKTRSNPKKHHIVHGYWVHLHPELHTFSTCQDIYYIYWGNMQKQLLHFITALYVFTLHFVVFMCYLFSF